MLSVLRLLTLVFLTIAAIGTYLTASASTARPSESVIIDCLAESERAYPAQWTADGSFIDRPAIP